MSANPTTQVVTEEIIAALTAEAAAAIVAGTTISALRDPRLLRARGAAHPSELLATEFRTIDRTGVWPRLPRRPVNDSSPLPDR